jgi:hypothetical protein
LQTERERGRLDTLFGPTIFCVPVVCASGVLRLDPNYANPFSVGASRDPSPPGQQADASL